MQGTWQPQVTLSFLKSWGIPLLCLKDFPLIPSYLPAWSHYLYSTRDTAGGIQQVATGSHACAGSRYADTTKGQSNQRRFAGYS